MYVRTPEGANARGDAEEAETRHRDNVYILLDAHALCKREREKHGPTGRLAKCYRFLPAPAVINPRQNWFTIVYAYTLVCARALRYSGTARMFSLAAGLIARRGRILRCYLSSSSRCLRPRRFTLRRLGDITRRNIATVLFRYRNIRRCRITLHRRFNMEFVCVVYPTAAFSNSDGVDHLRHAEKCVLSLFFLRENNGNARAAVAADVCGAFLLSS